MVESKSESRFAHKLYLVLLDNRDEPAARAGRSMWALQVSSRSGPAE